MSALFGPGSVLWLLRHDMRLGHRSMRSTSRQTGRFALGILGIVVTLLHLAGFAVAPALAPLRDQFRTDSLMAGTMALASLFALFLCKAISEATNALYDRGDLDLLLSSPLPMRRVLTTRLLAIAVISGIMPILLVFPVVNGMVLRGYFAWVGVYPVIASLSLGAAAIGSAATFGLLAWLGPRWTALGARVLSTLFGVLALLVSQIRLLFPGMTSSDVWVSLAAEARDGAQGILWWPARALIGEPLPMLVMIGSSLCVVFLVSAMLGRAYASGVIGHLAQPTANRTSDVVSGFGDTLFQALLRKEFVLMLRSPGLVSQMVYQFVFLIPGVIAVRRLAEQGGLQSQAGAVMLTVMMTGRIARIITAGPFGSDEAAGLAASSPASPSSTLVAKLMASSLMLGAVVGASLFVVWLAVPIALMATTVAATGAAATKLWLATGQERPLRRVGLQSRFSGDPGTLLGFMLDLCWGLFGVSLALAF